jgi:hypothetical protein
MHPIIDYIAEEWDQAAVEQRAPNIKALKISEVATRCTQGMAEHPTWSSVLHMKDLRLQLWHVSWEDKWWCSLQPAGGTPGEYFLFYVSLL